MTSNTSNPQPVTAPPRNARLNMVYQFMVRLGALAVLAFIGTFVMALSIHLCMMAGWLSADIQGAGYGQALSRNGMLVWLGAIGLGFISLFIKANWRWAITAAPAYAPAMYVILAVLIA